MGFFDDLGKSLDDIGNSVVDATKDLGKKAQEVGDVTKLQYDKKMKEQKLSKAFETMGRMFYQDNCDTIENESFTEIKELISEINDLNDQIMTIKGAMPCKNCGTLVKSGNAFCGKCGAKVNDIFED